MKKRAIDKLKEHKSNNFYKINKTFQIFQLCFAFCFVFNLHFMYVVNALTISIFVFLAFKILY